MGERWSCVRFLWKGEEETVGLSRTVGRESLEEASEKLLMIEEIGNNE